MKGSVWVYLKENQEKYYRFQVDGIKRGAYTKILDPMFKDWKQVGSGVNCNNSTEILIYSKSFSTEEDMISWVKSNVSFPTIYKKCNAKCTTKILVEDKDVVKNEKRMEAKQTARSKSGAVRKSKYKG